MQKSSGSPPESFEVKMAVQRCPELEQAGLALSPSVNWPLAIDCPGMGHDMGEMASFGSPRGWGTKVFWSVRAWVASHSILVIVKKNWVLGRETGTCLCTPRHSSPLWFSLLNTEVEPALSSPDASQNPVLNSYRSREGTTF